MSNFPPRCEGACPLNFDDADDQGIVLTRNCKGPRYSPDIPVTSTVVIKDGEVVDEHPSPLPHFGRVACSNTGFSKWVNAKRDQHLSI